MFLPAVFHSLDQVLKENRIHELLVSNEVLKKHGLVLTPADAEEIMAARSRVLKNQGRIELDINVSKTLLSRIARSSYVNQDNYVETVNDMYEIFHYIKNASSDLLSDEEVIDAIMVYYDQVCGGSTEFVMGKGIEKILDNYRHGRNMADIINEREEEYWELSD
jgi:hypothetical protein